MAHFYDTLLGEYIHNPWVRWLWLDKLALSYFDYKMISYEEVTQQKKINFKDVTLETASVYSGEDVYMTARIFEKQKANYEYNSVLYDNLFVFSYKSSILDLHMFLIHTDKIIESWDDEFEFFLFHIVVNKYCLIILLNIERNANLF